MGNPKDNLIGYEDLRKRDNPPQPASAFDVLTVLTRHLNEVDNDCDGVFGYCLVVLGHVTVGENDDDSLKSETRSRVFLSLPSEVEGLRALMVDGLGEARKLLTALDEETKPETVS